MRDASAATAEIIRENWNRVCAQVADACVRAGREPAEVRIVGVSKYVGPALALQLVQAGCRILGENRPQSLWSKFDYFRSLPSFDEAPMLTGDANAAGVPAVNRDRVQSDRLQWHGIGHLQRNKLRRTLPMLSYLHSLDSLRLAEAISLECGSLDLELPLLVEVNVTQDMSKTGLPADKLQSFLEQIRELPRLQIRGLMAMSSLGASEDEARREFERVRDLRDVVQREYAGQLQLSELSMGMSADFEQAIASGATMVRIGSSLWEGLQES